MRETSDEFKIEFRKLTEGVGLITKPFVGGNIDTNKEYLLVHTNIKIPFKKNWSFYKDAALAEKQILESMPDACVGYLLSNKFLKGNWETVTIWRDLDAVKAFYVKGEHAKIMFRWKGLVKYGENTITTRYKIQGMDLHINGYQQTKDFLKKIKLGSLDLWKEA